MRVCPAQLIASALCAPAGAATVAQIDGMARTIGQGQSMRRTACPLGQP